ncbi:hypothetical protein HDV00_005651 [Rhizophlyctis rosea]|nr:hypothetical protein HDV00_005651 [Rhizophlyctis rosea]
MNNVLRADTHWPRMRALPASAPLHAQRLPQPDARPQLEPRPPTLRGAGTRDDPIDLDMGDVDEEEMLRLAIEASLRDAGGPAQGAFSDEFGPESFVIEDLDERPLRDSGLPEGETAFLVNLADMDEADSVGRARNGVPDSVGMVSIENSATPTISSSAPNAATKPPSEEDQHMALLSAIFPDAHPAYLLNELQNQQLDVAAATVVILEEKGKYPKRGDDNPVLAKGKGPGKGKKRAREEDDEDTARKKFKDRSALDPHVMKSVSYARACHNQIRVDFPFVPDYYIRSILSQNNNQYIPTRLALQAVYDTGALPFQENKTEYRTKGKGAGDRELEEDIAIFEAHRKLEQADAMVEPPAAAMEEESGPSAGAAGRHGFEIEEEEGDITCGCCYGDYVITQMTHCEDGHLFCLECARRTAENVIGLRRTKIKCMDSSDCQFHFALSEIKRFLSDKVFEGYMRLCQEEDIKQAKLSGLEECPFCPFAMIMDQGADEDKLFVCQNDGCKAITCRKCRKTNHLPLSCEEAAKDNVLDVRHQIEEAMTEALLRECPKCSKKYYKTEGCNRMTCDCGQNMCYCCRAALGPNPYTHFAQNPDRTENANGTKCPLYDDAVQRNERDVKEAAERAIQMAVEENPTVAKRDVMDVIEGPKKKKGRR